MCLRFVRLTMKCSAAKEVDLGRSAAVQSLFVTVGGCFVLAFVRRLVCAAAAVLRSCAVR